MAEAVLIHDPCTLKMTAAAAYAPGEVVPLTARVGVYNTPFAATIGDEVTVHTGGVWLMAAQTGVAWSVDAQLYFDASNNYVTTTATGNTRCGRAAAAKGSSAATARVDLNAPGVALGGSYSVDLAEAEGTTDNVTLTVSFEDVNGNTLTGSRLFDLWLSDAATGEGLTSTTASGAVEAGANGVVYVTHTAKKHLTCLTKASNGLFTLSITDDTQAAFYVAVSNPFTGETVVSSALGAYGA